MSSESSLLPVVVAGPSGVGKGTLIGMLLKQYPNLFGFSVSHTTRAPREGEVNGVHYNFITVEEFEKLISENQFIEYAKVHTNYYGTSIMAVESILKQNKVCILDIDVQGVRNVKKSTLNCKYVFIDAPDFEELKNRLVGRGTESAEKIQIRLKNSEEEIAYGREEGNFDRILVNSDLNETYAALVGQLHSWFSELPLNN